MRRGAIPAAVMAVALGAAAISVPGAIAGGKTTTLRLSVKANGKEVPMSAADYPAVSGSGRFVAFEAFGQLVGKDTDTSLDIYVYDRERKKNELVSVNSKGKPGSNVGCGSADISPNGRYVSFGCEGELSNDDQNTKHDIYRHDRKTGKTILISVKNDETQLNGVDDDSEISGVADNGKVAWESYGAFTNDDFNTAYDTFVRDPKKGTTERASLDYQGNELSDGVGSLGPDKDSKISISGNGRFVAFSSYNQASPDDDFGFAVDRDVFVRDLKKDKTARASLKSNGNEADPNDNANSSSPSISANGRFVAFESDTFTAFDSHDKNNAPDIYVHDTKTGKTTLASVKSNGKQPAAVGLSPQFPEISANGRYVVWDSSWDFSKNKNNLRNVFRHDLKSGKTVLASAGSNGKPGDTSQLGDVANKSWVAFSSMAKLTKGADDGNDFDVFERGPLK